MSSLRQAYDKVALSDTGFFIRRATLDGLPTGDFDAAVDGSSTEVKFFTQPLPGQMFEALQLTLEVSDGGVPTLSDYGNIVGPLANGIVFFIEQDGVETLLPSIIKTNSDIITLGPETSRFDFTAAVTISTSTFSLRRFANKGVLLDGNTNDKFGMIVRDNLTGLENHTVVISGSTRIRSFP